MIRLRVKEVADEKGIILTRLFQRSEVSYNVIQGIFTNPYRVVTTETLNRLAEALGVPTTDLIEDVSLEQAAMEQEAIAQRKSAPSKKESLEERSSQAE